LPEVHGLIQQALGQAPPLKEVSELRSDTINIQRSGISAGGRVSYSSQILLTENLRQLTATEVVIATKGGDR